MEIRKARASDAEGLAAASKAAFDDDVNHGAPGPGGPEGYDLPGFQERMMALGDYYTILEAGEIIGGIIVFRKQVREYYLGRIFITPAWQNRGLGKEAMAFLWRQYPLAKRWTLDTPVWNARTRGFYASVGFREIGEDGEGGVLFERVMAGPSAPPSPPGAPVPPRLPR